MLEYFCQTDHFHRFHSIKCKSKPKSLIYFETNLKGIE